MNKDKCKDLLSKIIKLFKKSPKTSGGSEYEVTSSPKIYRAFSKKKKKKEISSAKGSKFKLVEHYHHPY